MNSSLLLSIQCVCIVALVGLVILNRSGWGDPKLPLFGLFLVVLVWLLAAIVTLALQGWLIYRQTTSINGESLLAVALAFIPLVMMFLLVRQSQQVPAIHDITTDTSNPPIFVYASQARHPSHNSVEYSTANIPHQQRAYPFVGPLLTNELPAQVLVTIEQLVIEQGWEIHRIDQEVGTVEASAVTPLLGFVDDIVFRVEPTDNHGEIGSRIDIRSASRIGVSDWGANAERIKEISEVLESRLLQR